jgi:hypothetical protein
MNAAFHAELIKLRRPRILAGAAVFALGFALTASLAVLLSVGAGPTTVADLEGAGGGTQALATGASFTGILVFVLFIAAIATEFSQGTFRMLLLRQPRRLALMVGKMGALLAFAAAVLALALVAGFLVSLAVAPSQGLATGAWLSGEGLAAAASDYVRVLAGWCAWATLGMTLAVLVRSVPIALGVGIAWSGPFEHLLADVWTAAQDWFPGLLLEELAAGGSAARTPLILAVYVALAAGATALALRRRDVVG